MSLPLKDETPAFPLWPIFGLLLLLLAAVQATPAPPAAEDRLVERAHQDREIVYFLQPPETHAFDLYHDYTESRAGTATYVNVVRAGSRASNPSAIESNASAAGDRSHAVIGRYPATRRNGLGERYSWVCAASRAQPASSGAPASTS